MTYNPYRSVVVPATAALTSLTRILRKASHHPNSASLLSATLYPDMQGISYRVAAATNCAARITARLAGADLPGWEDELVTLDDMLARITLAQEYMRQFSEETINARVKEPLHVQPNPHVDELLPFSSEAVAFGSSIPRLFFHVNMVYAIFRKEGVPLEMEDYIEAFHDGYKPLD